MAVEPDPFYELTELFDHIETIADVMQAHTGFRPDSVFLGPLVAEYVRQTLEKYPMLNEGTRPHARPASFPSSENWIGRIHRIEVYESAPLEE